MFLIYSVLLFVIYLNFSIFKQRPDIIDKFFVRVNGRDISSPKFQAHIARIFGGFDMCISLLDDPATLNANLNHLNGQHVAMGISAEYFNVGNIQYNGVNC